MASRPSQSPKLDSDIDSQSLRKSRTCRTARIFATVPTEPGTSSPARPSSGVVGAVASGGTGVCAAGTPSPPAAPSTPPPVLSEGGGTGGVGSDLIGAPGIEAGGRGRVAGAASRYRSGTTIPVLFAPTGATAWASRPRSETSRSVARVARVSGGQEPARPDAAWDPATYLRFAGERARPFLDLLARVRSPSPAVIVDLG